MISYKKSSTSILVCFVKNSQACLVINHLIITWNIYLVIYFIDFLFLAHLPSVQVHRPHWCGFLSGSSRWRLYGNLSLPGPLPRPPCRWLPGTARTKQFASSPAVAYTHRAYWYLAPAPQGLNAPTEPYTRSRPHTTDPEELVKKTTSHISFRDWVMRPVMQAFSRSLTVSVALLLVQFSDPVSIFMQCRHARLQLD